MEEDLFDKIEKKQENKNDPFYLEGEIIGHMNPFLPVKILIFLAIVGFIISLFYIIPKVSAKLSVSKDIKIIGAYNYYEDKNCKSKEVFNAYKLKDDHYFDKYMYATYNGEKKCWARQYGTWYYDPATKELVLTITSYTDIGQPSWEKHWYSSYFYEHFNATNNEKIVANEPNYTHTFVMVDELTYGD